MTALHWHPLAQAFIARMLNSAPEGVALTFLVWMYLRLLARRAAGVRFIGWFMALLAVVALPIFAGARIGGSVTAVVARSCRQIVLPASWAEYLFAIWAIGALLLLLRIGVGAWRLHGYRNRCAPIDLGSLDPEVAETVRRFGSKARTEVFVSGDLFSPAVIGFFRPAIVIPASLLPQLSAVEIEIILLHELAHLRRRDQWSNLAQKFVKALFFFHPAVWWIESRLTLEREMACDELVVQSANPKAYASVLISICEKLQNPNTLALAEALVNRVRQLSLRIAQILDAKRGSRTPWRLAVSVGAGLIALTFGAAASMPHLVSFQAQSPASTYAASFSNSQANHTLVAHDSGATGRADSDDISAVRSVRSAPQPVAVPASYHPREAARPLHPPTHRSRPLVHAKVVQKQLPSDDSLVIVQVQLDDAGTWTQSVWRVERASGRDRGLEMIIFGSI